MAAHRAILVGAILLVAMAVNVEGVCKQLDCPRDNGYFAHPRSCVAYVKCVEGKAFLEKCPANLHYNPGTGVCDLPENSQCVEEVKLRSTSCKLSPPPRLRSAPVPGIECDCGKCCRKPNPLDCTKFFECDESGNAFSKSCSSGLVYNPVKEDCDLNTNYECPKIPSCSCKCRYPVDDECDAFYRCEEVGKPVNKEYCSEGLIFNPDTEMCDLPDNVDCPAGPVPTVAPGECKDFKSDCKYWVANGDCICDEFKSGDCSWQHYVQRNCPNTCKLKGCSGSPDPPVTGGGGTGGVIEGCLIDCVLGQYYRHPFDCTKFIQCAPYGPQEMPCAAGTRWDQDLLTCNHASQTNCVTGQYKDSEGKDCGGGVIEVVPTNPPAPVPTEPPINPPTIDGCVINCQLGQYYRHPFDCTKFIQCAPYGPQEMPCAAGTRWDQDLLTCNHASQTKCVTGQYKDLEGKDCGGEVIEVVPTNPPAPVPTEPPINPPTIDGCVINCQLGQYYRHPFDCTKFIQCAPYGPQEMPCAAGTRWDQDLLTCNHASQTKCVTGQYKDLEGKDCGGEVIEVVPTNPPAPVPTEPPINPPTIDGCVINCQLGQYYRHPFDCTKFIQCAPYGPQEMPCGAGTRWDQDILTCNHASQTKCVTGQYKDLEGKDCGGEVIEVVPTNPPAPVPTEPPINPPTIDGCVINCQLGQYYRHPFDCTKFIQCAPYGPQEMPCGAGTRWDQDILTCNHASSTDCVTGSYLDKDGNKCGGEPEQPAGPDCEIDCSKGQYHRHPTDCTKFIQCAPYGPQEMPCGAGTRWDQNLLTCNHASATPCVTGNGDCVSTITESPPKECDLQCPQANGEFAHPRDCKKWIHCSNNIVHIKDCPANLLFDPTKKVCNWPQETVCVSTVESGCEVPIIPTPTSPAVVPPEVCDCECCLRPHPEDCQSYYYCDGTNTEFYTCSEGLVFHPQNETCVFAADYPQCNIIVPPECECECLYPSPICSEYFKCVDDKPERKECPNGLYFNAGTHACDLPANVECKTVLSKRSGFGRLVPAIGADDCDHLPDGRYANRANPDDFYHCARGVAFLLKCQAGGTFSQRTGRCERK